MKSKSKKGAHPSSCFGSGLLFMAALAPLLAGCADNEAVNRPLDWIVGHWCADLDGISAEELWKPPEDGVFVGVGRTRNTGRTSVEYLRITDTNGVQSYIAEPPGQRPTTYKRTAGGESWVRFENPEHDFPQRIEYRREGERLHAEISGSDKDDEEAVYAFDFGPCEP